MKKLLTFLQFIGCIFTVSILNFTTAFAISTTSHTSALNDFPKFITAPHMTINRIKRISRFRSTVGHPYTCPACQMPEKNKTTKSKTSCQSGYVKCQNEKHYFDFFIQENTPQIIAPCNGTIVNLFQEDMGTQIWIQPDGYKNYQVRLFHIKGLTLKIGSHVSAGEILGTHYTNDTYSDIAIINLGGTQCVLTSAFEHMTQGVLGQFGVTVDQMIIPQEERDLFPSHCLANKDPCRDQMPNPSGEFYPPNWVTING